MAVEDGTKIQVHYKGTLEDGTVFDESYGREPLEFTIGADEVIPGFEDAVTDMSVGDKKTVTLAPDVAYGEHIAEAVQEIPADAFSESPEVGMTVNIIAQDGTPLMATVVDVEGDEVTLDFNHPLAGKTLQFELEFVGVCD